MPPKTLARAGLALVAMAVLLAWATDYWMQTRKFDALDVPITTSEGHWRTEPFRLNISEKFSIRIDTDTYHENEKEKDPCSPAASLLWTWQVFRREGWFKPAWKQWDNSGWQLGQGPSLGWFDAEPGTYLLDARFLRGGACLNARHPKLLIWTYSRDPLARGNLLYILCIFILGTGVALILRGGRGWLAEKGGSPGPPRIFPALPLKNAIALHKHRPMPLVREPPNFGIVWGSVLYILAIIFATSSNATPYGLGLHLKNTPSLAVANSPWRETLGVYVDGQRQFYVNGQKIARAALRPKLKEELARRMVWTVYFEAALDDPFMDTAYVIDIVQGLGGNVVWITPKMREDLNQEVAKGAPSP